MGGRESGYRLVDFVKERGRASTTIQIVRGVAQILLLVESRHLTNLLAGFCEIPRRIQGTAAD